MKGGFYHRRMMAYLAMLGLLLCACGVVFLDIKDGAIGGIAGSFAVVIGAYMTNATYDDHSHRKHGVK